MYLLLLNLVYLTCIKKEGFAFFFMRFYWLNLYLAYGQTRLNPLKIFDPS